MYRRSAARVIWLGALLVMPQAAAALDPSCNITQYARHPIGSREGLPSSTVTKVVQTPDGYLWFATEEGLARFDGLEMTVFDRTNVPELTVNEINALAVDRAGRLWIGTAGGGVVSYATGQFRREAVALQREIILTLFEAADGSVWVGTENGEAAVLRNRLLSRYTIGEAHSVTSFAQTGDGVIWIGTVDAGLFRFDEGEILPETTTSTAAGLAVNELLSTEQGLLLVGTTTGLFEVVGGEAIRSGPSKTDVRAIVVDRDGNRWAGSRSGGLIRISSSGEVQTLAAADGIDSVESLFVDREGSLWVGTMGGGAVQLHDSKFLTLSSRDGVASEDAFAILEDREGTVWIGTWGSGLTEWRNGAVVKHSRLTGLPSDNVVSLFEDSRGALWIGTDLGLACMRKGRIEGAGSVEWPSDLVTAIAEGPQGELWVGTDGAGLWRIGGEAARAFRRADGLPSDRINALLWDRGTGALWIGTFGEGLARMVNGAFERVAGRRELSSDVVWSMHLDERGVLWAGTDGGGLCRVENGRVDRIDTAGGLHDNVVFRILEDDAGRFWMSSNRGVFSASRREIEAVMRGEAESVECRSYDEVDGMISRECNGGSQTAGWKTRDGRLWFPTIAGVTIVDPARLKMNRVRPPVVLSSVSIDGEPDRMDSSEVVVPAGSVRVQFQFAALSFIGPRRVKCRYRLDGYDEDWTEAGASRLASYTRVPPGSYTFTAIAANADGVWNDQGASVTLSVLPRFHQTAWFKLVTAASILLAAWSIYALRVWQIKSRFLAVLSERQRISRELHDTLMQGLAAISVQLHAIERDGGAEGDTGRTVGRIRQMIERNIAEVRRSVADLRSLSLERAGLSDALRGMAEELLGTAGIQVRVSVTGVPVRLTHRIETNVLRIAQEAITNIGRHSGCRNTEVDLDFTDERLRVVVRDDGRGFDPTSAPGAAEDHFGLEGMRERAVSMNGVLNVKSRPGAGTEIELVVPRGDG